MNTWVETSTAFGIPRFYPLAQTILARAGEVIDKTSIGLPISFSMTFPKRPEQVSPYNKFLQLIADGATGILLHGKTGMGKTVMGLSFAQHLQTTTLVVVPRNFIVQQWIERILQHTTIKREEIGIAQQSRCDFQGKKIVVGMVHSLAKDKYPPEFKRWPGLLLVDETHIMGAETFSEVLKLFPAKYRIGLSATMTRTDGMSDVYKWAIGEHTITASQVHRQSPNVVVVRYNGKGTYLPQWFHGMSDKKKRMGVILSALAEDPIRNKLLAKYLVQLTQKGRRILFLSHRVGQIKEVRDEIVKLEVSNVGVFIQSTAQKDREGVVNDSLVLLATYQICSMAVDLDPSFSTLVLGTPQADVVQAVGRIMRDAPDKLTPMILDFVDVRIRDCVGWHQKRRKLWLEMGAQIKEIIV